MKEWLSVEINVSRWKWYEKRCFVLLENVSHVSLSLARPIKVFKNNVSPMASQEDFDFRNNFQKLFIGLKVSLTTFLCSSRSFQTNSNMYPTKPITPSPPERFIFCKKRPTSSEPELSAGNSASAHACFSVSVPSALLTALLYIRKSRRTNFFWVMLL